MNDDDDDNESLVQPNKNGLKFDNKKSIVNTFQKKVNPIKTEKIVAEKIENSQGYKSEAANLVVMFKKILEDKTLSDNRSSLAEDAEKELIGKMINLAIKINNDENEEEGMGSIGLSIVLLRSLLFQRDKINKLDYELFQSNKKIKLLQEKIELLLVDKTKANE